MKKLIPFLVVLAIAVFGCLSEDHSGGTGTEDTLQSDTIVLDSVVVDSAISSELDSVILDSL